MNSTPSPAGETALSAGNTDHGRAPAPHQTPFRQAERQMKSVLQDALRCVVEAVETTTATDGGVTFHRSPASARARLGDPSLHLPSAVPSGVRLELLTDAPAIDLEVHLARLVFGDAPSTGSTFDVVVDGVLSEPVRTLQETVLRVKPPTFEPVAEPAGPAITLPRPRPAQRHASCRRVVPGDRHHGSPRRPPPAGNLDAASTAEPPPMDPPRQLDQPVRRSRLAAGATPGDCLNVTAHADRLARGEPSRLRFTV
jgi:hypothetical protein